MDEHDRQKVEDALESFISVTEESYKNYKAPEKAFSNFEELKDFVNRNQELTDKIFSSRKATVFKKSGLTTPPIPKTVCKVFLVDEVRYRTTLEKETGVFIPSGVRELLITSLHELQISSIFKGEQSEIIYQKKFTFPGWFRRPEKGPEHFVEYFDIRSLGLVDKGMLSNGALFKDPYDALEESWKRNESNIYNPLVFPPIPNI